jgi:hypothetical protein
MPSRGTRVVTALVAGIAMTLALPGCGGGVITRTSDVASTDDRNQAARPAISYADGAAFVDALRGAGVPCVSQGIDEMTVTVGVAGGAVVQHVADSVECRYSDSDWVSAVVGLDPKYYELYSRSFHEAGARVRSKTLTLVGERWLVTAPHEERLFATQDALGGQLCLPSACVALVSGADE